MELLFIGIDLMQKCLLVIKIFISILVHFRVIFPVIFVHSLDFFLPLRNGLADLGNPRFQFLQNISKVLFSVLLVYHHEKISWSF